MSITKRVSSWDEAIEDYEERIRELRKAIKVFREQKKRGEPWLAR